MLFLIVVLLILVLIQLGGGALIGSIVNFIIVLIAVALGTGWITDNGLWLHVGLGIGLLIFVAFKLFKYAAKSDDHTTIHHEAVNMDISLGLWRVQNIATKLHIVEKLIELLEVDDQLSQLNWVPMNVVQELTRLQDGTSAYMDKPGFISLREAMLNLIRKAVNKEVEAVDLEN